MCPSALQPPSESQPATALKPTKVFVIGFHKTGTTSMHYALRRLGYSITGIRHFGPERTDIADVAWKMAKNLIDRFDAFEDNPWPILYREIYAYRPDSKFILTVRTPESWLKSVIGHFGTGTTPMRTWIYGAGSPVGHEDIYRERFERHYREVREFFRDKPDQLLTMDLAAGDGWEKLCTFLGVSRRPKIPFPHRNDRSSRETQLQQPGTKARQRQRQGRRRQARAAQRPDAAD